MRYLLAFALCTGVAAPQPAPPPHDAALRVTLLGTGTPIPVKDRSGPATLVEAGGHALLFDVGRGVPPRLFELGIPLRDVGPVFLTHLHSDHVVGIPDLYLSGWLPGPWARRTTPFRIIGPVGTKRMMTGIEQAFADDIRIRIADENLPRAGVAVAVKEFREGGVVYDDDGLRVIAFPVDHGEKVRPAFGYRIEYRGHAVVLSGDTKLAQTVIRQGTGADLLVHEVAAVRPENADDAAIRPVMAHHTSPRDAGKVFRQARPKLVVYTHILLLQRPSTPQLTVQDIVDQTRETYDGPLEVGEDLMSFDVGDAVTVRRHEPDMRAR